MVRRVVVALRVASAVGGGLGMREYRGIDIVWERSSSAYAGASGEIQPSEYDVTNSLRKSVPVY